MKAAEYTHLVRNECCSWSTYENKARPSDATINAQILRIIRKVLG